MTPPPLGKCDVRGTIAEVPDVCRPTHGEGGTHCFQTNNFVSIPLPPPDLGNGVQKYPLCVLQLKLNCTTLQELFWRFFKFFGTRPNKFWDFVRRLVLVRTLFAGPLQLVSEHF